MMSKIMAKCVFGLHRRGRIACPPFSNRGQRMIRFRWYLGLVVGVASKVCPKGAKGMPQWTQMSVKGVQKEPKGWPRESKGAQRVPKGCLKGAQRCPRMPKGCSMGGQWSPRYAQRPRDVKIGSQITIMHHTRYQQMTKNITSLAWLALSFVPLSLMMSL